MRQRRSLSKNARRNIIRLRRQLQRAFDKFFRQVERGGWSRWLCTPLACRSRPDQKRNAVIHFFIRGDGRDRGRPGERGRSRCPFVTDGDVALHDKMRTAPHAVPCAKSGVAQRDHGVHVLTAELAHEPCPGLPTELRSKERVRFQIEVFAREPGKWRASIRRSDGSKIRVGDMRFDLFITSVNTSTADQALQLQRVPIIVVHSPNV